MTDKVALRLNPILTRMPECNPNAGEGWSSGRTQAFPTTHWSAVLTAGDSAAPGVQAALETLCQSYWYPVYAFLRRQGQSSHDAQELTQEFFARLMQKKHLRLADPIRGKFRSFLLATLKHFLLDERKKARAQKRGGDRTVISLDAEAAEERYSFEPVNYRTPERLFDRRWALTILERAVNRLQQEYAEAGKLPLFEELKQFQPGESAEQSYAQAAQSLGITDTAVKAAIYRMRKRHRELLRDEVAQTVLCAADVDAEIRHLIDVLSTD